jgi:outer membrane protein OmpA-like peptidoglycan-associated protein
MASSSHSSSNELASSLTDLMTSLAIIFVLLLVASVNNMQRKTQQTVKSILVELQKQLEEYVASGVQVSVDPKDPLGLLILVPEGLLQFQTNKDVIPAAGVEFLKSFAPKLATIACSPEFKPEINSIVIEGHADSSGDVDINLPLSQRRSMAVVTQSLNLLAVSEPIGQASALKSCFLNFVSATGRGSEEPILKADQTEDPDRSRRVVFKIRVRSLEQRQITKIVS